jgi:hypothetical protein
VFDQIYDEVTQHGGQPWASCEGTNVIPGEAPGSSGFDMETYLARAFNHGATLVNVFGWGIGNPSMPMSNPFSIVTQGDDALTAYRKFLNQ